MTGPHPGERNQPSPDETPRHRLTVAARTDPGLIRTNNEDSYFAGRRVLVVADGMGGHAAGEVASRLVVDAISPLDNTAPSVDLADDLIRATRRGNAAIADMVDAHPELDGMGTTATALLFDGRRAALAHVGDSRAYLYRSGVLHQLTHDDTFVQSLVDEGRITEAQAHDHPQRNLVLRALTGLETDPITTERETHVGDRFLVCSDGLSGVVAAELIGDALADPDPSAAADALIELALNAGAPDNVTVIVADVVEIDSAAAGPAPSARIAEGADDPASTNPLQQLTREMPRVPLPPIPEEPGASAEMLSAADDLDGDDEDDEEDDEYDDDAGEGAGDETWGGAQGIDDLTDAEPAEPVGVPGPGGAAGSTGPTRSDDQTTGAATPLASPGEAVDPSAAPAGAAAETIESSGSGSAETPAAPPTRAPRHPESRPGRNSRELDDAATATDRGRGGSRSGKARPGGRTAPRPTRRRWYRRGAAILAAVVLLGVAVTGSAMWVRHQYFVSDQGNLVVVFRGVDGSILGWHLATFEETSCAGNTNCTPMRVSDLQPAAQNQVRTGIKATSLADARDVVNRLSAQLLPLCPPVESSGSGAVGARATDGPGASGGSTGAAETPTEGGAGPAVETAPSTAMPGTAPTPTSGTQPAAGAEQGGARTTAPAATAPAATALAGPAVAGPAVAGPAVAGPAVAANGAHTADAAARPAAEGAAALGAPAEAAAGATRTKAAASDAAAAPHTGRLAAENSVIPGQVAPNLAAPATAAAANPAAATATATNATDAAATTHQHTEPPTHSAVTVTETVTATPLAPAPAIPGVNCRSLP